MVFYTLPGKLVRRDLLNLAVFCCHFWLMHPTFICVIKPLQIRTHLTSSQSKYIFFFINHQNIVSLTLLYCLWKTVNLSVWILPIRSPFCYHSLTLIPAWISAGKVWDEFTYLFPNFNSATVTVWKWINNLIPHLIMDVIHAVDW